MFVSQTVRTGTKICILSLLVTCLWYLSGSALSQRSQNKAKNLIPIEVTQIPPHDGAIPVTLRCQTVEYPKPQEAKALSCVITNNSNSPITAVSLAYIITSEGVNGEKSTDDGFIILDALVHPDFHDSNSGKFIHPGAERVIQRGRPIEDSNFSAEQIGVHIDYVEFENGTTVGPNTNGSHLIAQRREGADAYKRWLKAKYLENSRSMQTIVPLLKSIPFSAAELKLDDGLPEVGAEEYQKNARELLNKRGPGEIEKKLSSNDSPKP